MDNAICLDSDVIIGILKNNPRAISFLHSADVNYYTTAINVFEVRFGRTSDGKAEQFLAKIQSLPFDENAAKAAASIQTELSATGKMLDAKDLFVGSICIANGMRLLTFNRKHFERLGKFGLELVEA